VQQVNLHDYPEPAIVGNFLAGHTTSEIQDESSVSWHELASPGGPVVTTKTIPLKKVWRVQVRITELEMNRDGVLLLRLREIGKNRMRYVCTYCRTGAIYIPQSRAAGSDTVD
jgi:hypothetical protein